MRCKTCYESMVYIASREKDDLVYHFFYCYKCGVPEHEITYKYTPDTCPKHQVEHLGVKFVDDFHCHTLMQVDRCTRCGAVRETPRDTRQAGFSGRNEIDDPRVSNRLLFNKSSWERKIPLELRELSASPPSQEIVLPKEVDL